MLQGREGKVFCIAWQSGCEDVLEFEKQNCWIIGAYSITQNRNCVDLVQRQFSAFKICDAKKELKQLNSEDHGYINFHKSWKTVYTCTSACGCETVYAIILHQQDFNIWKMKMDMQLKINFKNDPLLLLPPKFCLTAHYSCQSQNFTVDDSKHWMEVTNYVCYVTLPVVLFFAIIGQMINIVMQIKQIRLSMDTYLLGLSFASLLLVFSTIAISLQYYVGYHEILVIVQSYAILCRDCFWYTSLWLLVLMSLERSLSVSIINQSQSLCSSAQALVVVILVFCIGLVSALPRFWEYQVEKRYDVKTNTTALVLQKSMIADIPEYNSIYFWYGKIITIFLPYPLMLIISTALCCSTRASAIEQREIPDKHVTSTAMIINRREREETDLTKLVIFLILMYLLLCAPFNILELLSSPIVNWVKSDDLLIVTLQNLFTICFYIYYMIHQQLYFCYNKQFRLTLLSICCCCC